METIVTIRNGEITFDAIGGQGDECRRLHTPYLDDLRRELGLPLDAVIETVKPELYATETQTQQDQLHE